LSIWLPPALQRFEVRPHFQNAERGGKKKGEKKRKPAKATPPRMTAVQHVEWEENFCAIKEQKEKKKKKRREEKEHFRCTHRRRARVKAVRVTKKEKKGKGNLRLHTVANPKNGPRQDENPTETEKGGGEGGEKRVFASSDADKLALKRQNEV